MPRPLPQSIFGPLRAVVTLVITLTFAAGGASAETVIHSEDFTSRAYADAALTTAAWDTTTARLHLYPQGLAEVGALDLAGQSYAAAWKSGRLLIANGAGNALLVINVDDPAAPVLVRTHNLPAAARHVTVGGDWAYVSLASGLGVQIVNVTNVNVPVTGARVDLGGYTGQTVLAGNWAYTASYPAGVGVIEISDPANPVTQPAANLTAWVRAVAVQGAYLYAGADASLTVMSLASPAAPDSIASVPVSGSAYCVTTSGAFAYVGGPAGVDILDIAQPASPQFLSNVPLGGGAAYDISVQGDSLFVANGNNGLHIVDIGNPQAPVVVGSRYSVNYFYHTVLQDDLVWTSHGEAGLLVLEADPAGLDATRNVAVSKNLNPAAEPIVRARLSAVYSDSIRFEVTTDGGGIWLDIAPDDTWLTFDPQGTSLRWRATLVPTGVAGGPVCEQLTLAFERVQNAAEITAVSDVPGDTGGQVRLQWLASRFDAAGQSPAVTEYSVYRRYEGALQAAAAYPPGDWEYLLSVPADREATYAVPVPTVADSSQAGRNWAVYFVRARTATAGTYFDSAPDSGYSVNNLAPAPPTGFQVAYQAGGAQLDWDVSPDPDFAHFRIYRVASPLIQPSPGSLYQVTGSAGFFDATTEVWHYQLTQVNLAGLESPPAVRATPVPGLPAGGGAIRQIVPNPFNPVTTIAYSVPAGGRPVRLDVLDARGRLVAVLVDAFVAGGEQSAVWRGTDSRGRAAASGVYSCRLHCGDVTTTRKMMLVR